MHSPPVVFLLGASPGPLQAFAAGVRAHLASGRQAQLHCLAEAAQVAPQPGALYLLLGQALRPGAASAEAARDLALRAALLRHGLGFQVIHAAPPERQLHQALSAIAQQLGADWVQSWPAQPQAEAPRRRWTGPCEKCSDPDCEHQLFQSLLKERPPAGG
ncbi:MAG: hypothetical protein ACN6O3_21320 [Comamonas sp.]